MTYGKSSTGLAIPYSLILLISFLTQLFVISQATAKPGRVTAPEIKDMYYSFGNPSQSRRQNACWTSTLGRYARYLIFINNSPNIRSVHLRSSSARITVTPASRSVGEVRRVNLNGRTHNLAVFNVLMNGGRPENNIVLTATVKDTSGRTRTRTQRIRLQGIGQLRGRRNGIDVYHNRLKQVYATRKPFSISGRILNQDCSVSRIVYGLFQLQSNNAITGFRAIMGNRRTLTGSRTLFSASYSISKPGIYRLFIRNRKRILYLGPRFQVMPQVRKRSRIPAGRRTLLNRTGLPHGRLP